MSTFLGVWPVEDDSLTVQQAAEIADSDLVLLAWDQGLVLTSTPAWSITEGDVEGHPSPTGLYLTCTADARKHTQG